MDIGKEVKDLKRLKEILIIAFEGGFGYIINKIKLHRSIPLSKRLRTKEDEKENLTDSQRLRITLERLGPTFVKFGQILSLRPDLLPKEYIKELEKLQDQVPSFPYEQAKKIIEHDLNGKVEDFFEKFDEVPIASASISQVHKATLKKTKEIVAVKVRRPNIVDTIDSDIEIMLHLAKLLEKYMPSLRRYNLIGLVEEFSEWTKKELDFRKEARNGERFRSNFKGSKDVYIPKIYKNLSTKCVLVSEFIEGVDIRELPYLKNKKINVKKAIEKGYSAMLTQVFIHGFFHADPHPGNILIVKGNKIAFLDYGIVGYFDNELKNKCIDIVYGIVEDDAQRIVDAFLELSNIEKTDKDMERFRDDIGDIIEELQGATLRKVKFSSVLEEVLDVALRHQIKMPLDFVLFSKTIVTLEGIALQYDPEFRIIDATKPFVDKLVLKERPIYMVNKFLSRTNEIIESITSMPVQVHNVLKNLQKGKIQIDIKDNEIRRLGQEIDKSSNRLVYGMLIASFVIAAAWTVNLQGGPRIWDIHLMPFMFLGLAFTISIALLVSISREKQIE